MNRPLLFLLVIGLGASALPAAEQPSAAELKLREALRNTMLQMRTVETERATLQAEAAESALKEKALTEKVETLTKQLAAEGDAAQKTITAQKEQMVVRDQEVAALKAELEKWKAEQQRITKIAETKEAQRSELAGKAVVLQRRVDDQQTKNGEMYKVGSEVLRRYEKFVLGDALAAREPFTGIARVKFETLAQDFRDQLDDARVKPLEVQSSASANSAPSKDAKTKAAKTTNAKKN